MLIKRFKTDEFYDYKIRYSAVFFTYRKILIRLNQLPG